MLGLSSGIIWGGVPLLISQPPQDDLVGHWDFTDVTQLVGSLSGTFSGAYLDGADPIGRCKNKAPSVITPDGDERLGQWVRAETNDKRPLFFTGGANGNSYAKFDNSSHTQGLVARSTDANNWGGSGTNILGTAELRAENISIFIVGEPLDDDSDGADEVGFSYFGYYDRPSGTPANESVSFNIERQDDEDIDAVWHLGFSGAAVSPNSLNSTNATRHWSSGSTSIINIQTAIAAGESHIYTNNSSDTGQTIYNPTSGPAAQNAWANMDPVNWDDSLTCSVGIGGKVNADGEIQSNSFEGKIYEVLIYKSALSEVDRLALTDYFAYKYNITLIQ